MVYGITMDNLHRDRPTTNKESYTLPRNWGKKRHEEEENFSRIYKGSPRQSLSPHSPAFYKWIEAQELNQHKLLAGKLPIEENNNTQLYNGQPITCSRELNNDVIHETVNKPVGVANANIMEYLQPSNTRNIGDIIDIYLAKGEEGLGFSVTTRDNMPGSDMPVYVKAILPRGPAVRDGQLRTWDRLLSVNGVEMTGKSQQEAVQVLREIPVGSNVHLVVSRQPDTSKTVQVASETHTEMPITEISLNPIELSPDIRSPSIRKSANAINTEDNKKPGNKRTLEVSITRNDRGLGIAVRGKTSNQDKTTVDIGIFVRAIAVNGAAAQDGRVKINDQLLEINGLRLAGRSNMEALGIMRTVLQKAGPSEPISLVLARRRRAPPPPVSAGETTDRPTLVMDKTDGPRPLMDKNDVQSHPADKVQRSASPAPSFSYERRAQCPPDCTPPIRKAPAPPVPSVSKSRAVDTSAAPLAMNAANLAKSLESLLDSELDTKNDLILDVTPKFSFAREGFGRKSMSEKRKGYVDPRISELYLKIKSSRALGTSPTLKQQREELRRSVSMCSLSQSQKPSDILYCTRL